MFDPAVEKAKMKYFLVGFGSSGVEPFDPVGKDCTCSGDGKQLFQSGLRLQEPYETLEFLDLFLTATKKTFQFMP